jgi:hypothetical protein
MPGLDADGWKDKSVDVASDVSKQLITLGLGAIAFAVGITSQDAVALRQPLFWWVIGFFGVSTLLGFAFLAMVVSSEAGGTRPDVYGGARWPALLQVLGVLVGTVLLLVFHVNAVARRSGSQETRLTVQQPSGKGTTLSVQPGKSVTIVVSPSGELTAHVK